MSLRVKRTLFFLALGLSVGWSLAIWHDLTMLPPGHVYEIAALNLVFYVLVFMHRDLNHYGTVWAQWRRIGLTLLVALCLMGWASKLWATYSTLQTSN